MINRPKCRIQVAGERELNKGRPPQELPAEVNDQRTKETLSSADYIVLFSKTPIIPEGWTEVTAREFEFARYKLKTTSHQVVILERK
ncbi:MAG: hypothetical protein H6Q37_175 [Chloroflexi bacterium]|nr:hypothetical protein [Chloroflexota bacterium]